MPPPDPAESDPLAVLSAEDRARYANLSPHELARTWNDRYLGDQADARRLADARAHTRAVGVLLVRRMVAAGVPSVTVGQGRDWVVLTPHADGRGLDRRVVERPRPGPEAGGGPP